MGGARSPWSAENQLGVSLQLGTVSWQALGSRKPPGQNQEGKQKDMSRCWRRQIPLGFVRFRLQRSVSRLSDAELEPCAQRLPVILHTFLCAYVWLNFFLHAILSEAIFSSVINQSSDTNACYLPMSFCLRKKNNYLHDSLVFGEF